MEVAYLLQRTESYEGLAILTTNLRDHFLEIALAILANVWERHAGQPTPGRNSA
jgi:hypothetical protein